MSSFNDNKIINSFTGYNKQTEIIIIFEVLQIWKTLNYKVLKAYPKKDNLQQIDSIR